ncbi:MAG: cytochrome c peroxidase [Bacteroidota bacterium]
MKRLLILLSIPLLLGYMQLSLDQQLRQTLSHHGIEAQRAATEPDSAKIELGRMLFYDKILSGNKDISCASCHHPSLNSGDALTLSIGVGGQGLGKARIMGKDRERIPRNSPEIFNRGSQDWHSMFWDSRVQDLGEKGWYTPADEKFPQEGFDNILAVQAMFPVTSRDEMRGEIGDLDIEGNVNELALISPGMPQSIWFALMRRLKNIPEYVALFTAAYPEIDIKDLSFVHAANAIAAYEISAFTYLDSPWDAYLNGNEEALTEQQKRGALFFYQEGSCVACHSGNLMTDQKAHNLGIPQFGPGKDIDAPLDYGHIVESGNSEDLFAFRTPPLRNVVLTGPWMHNGAYDDLEAAIRHHLNPLQSLKTFPKEHLPLELQLSFQDDEGVMRRIGEKIDPLLKSPALQASETEIADVLSFMDALSEESALKQITKAPERVPSGLPVDDI